MAEVDEVLVDVMFLLALTIAQQLVSTLTAAETILYIILILTFLLFVIWLLFEETLLRLAGWVNR